VYRCSSSASFPKRTLLDAGSRVAPTLGNPLVDDYLESVHARLRPNSTLAVVYDLKVFFSVIDVVPIEVRRHHVLEFIRIQRTGSSDAAVVPIDQSEGLAPCGHLPEQHRGSHLVGRCQPSPPVAMAAVTVSLGQGQSVRM